MSADDHRPDREASRKLRAHLRERRPSFTAAIRADAARADRPLPTLLGDRAFLALAVYRARSRMHGLGVPVLPRLLHRLSISVGRLYVGDPVVIEAGVRIPEGRAVIDGLTEVAVGAEIGPETTIGLRAGDFHGPRIGAAAVIGASARVIGPVSVGDGARVAPGSVVLADVAAGASVAGAPARAAGEPAGSPEAGIDV